MEIKRIYNNNVVVAVNGADGPEMIAIGKGLAFQKKPGDSIEQEKVEKIFTLEDSGVMTRLEKLVKDIPSVYLSISEEVVEMIRRDSDLKISEDLYITLTDHISMSLEREKNHVICENPLLLEIRQFYKEEFMLARKAGEIIWKKMGIRISEEEMGFIALHIVNASMDQRASCTIQSIQMVRNILQIVSEYFDVNLDETSIPYDRFVRHLQFFARRVLGEGSVQSADEFLFTLGRSQYPVAYGCAEKIGDYVKKTYHKDMTNAEKGFLVYHIINTLSVH